MEDAAFLDDDVVPKDVGEDVHSFFYHCVLGCNSMHPGPQTKALSGALEIFGLAV